MTENIDTSIELDHILNSLDTLVGDNEELLKQMDALDPGFNKDDNYTYQNLQATFQTKKQDIKRLCDKFEEIGESVGWVGLDYWKKELEYYRTQHTPYI